MLADSTNAVLVLHMAYKGWLTRKVNKHERALFASAGHSDRDGSWLR